MAPPQDLSRSWVFLFALACLLAGCATVVDQRRHSARIVWIERVLEEISDICSDDDAVKEAYVLAGRFGSTEALRRLRMLVKNRNETAWRCATFPAGRV